MSDKVGKFKFDSKTLSGYLTTIRSSRKAFEAATHQAAVICAIRAIVHKDVASATRLIAAVGGVTGITLIRSNAIKDWFIDKAPMQWVNEAFKLDGKRREALLEAYNSNPEAFINALLDEPIQETKPEPKYKDFNLLDHIIKQVTSMNEGSESMAKRKAAGMEVDLSDKQDILDALMAIKARKVVHPKSEVKVIEAEFTRLN